jgi:hypothetical protein
LLALLFPHFLLARRSLLPLPSRERAACREAARRVRAFGIAGIPVLGAAWLLRLISRFLNNNQVLADDARHRQVMTQTYLALVADPNSQVTEKDRLIMLNAIFRPLPGAQTDEVAPPTILDLLKKPD